MQTWKIPYSMLEAKNKDGLQVVYLGVFAFKI